MKKLNSLFLMFAVAVFVGGCGTAGSGFGPSADLQIDTSALPAAQVQSPYAASVQASGGTPPYSWVVKRGNWPVGVILNSSTGTIAGAPGQTGRFGITLGATDSSTPPKTTTQILTLTVSTSQVAISTTSLPSGAVSVAYSSTLAATNGTAPYTWSIASGSLPKGLSLNSTSGTISGTPTQAATSSFSVLVTDSNSTTATASFSVAIASASTPVVNGVSPSSGSTAGGTTVTISGANFASGASVTFGGSAASSVTVASTSQIVAVSPSHVAGNAAVAVSLNGQASTSSANFTYTASQSAAPTISSVSPSSGVAGTQVTITGTSFNSADIVSFGATNATSTYVSATQMTAVVPSIATGSYGVTVTDPDPATVTLNNGFTVTAPASAPAQPSGNQGLLSGCSYIGSGGCSLPSGWTMVAQQDFECTNSHAVPANPSCGTLPSAETTSVNGNNNQPASTFEQSQVHSGSYAFGGQYAGDGAQINLIYGNGNGGGSSSNLGSFTTLYLSWWEYTDPNAQYGNSDYYLFHVGSPTTCGGILQDVAYDAQPGGGGGAAPSSSATMLPVANGLTGGNGCQGFYQWGNAGSSASGGNVNLPMLAGQWRQVEVLYTPSTGGTPNSNDSPNADCTSTGQSNCGNGTLKLYINGVLQQESLNANLNGTTNMANSFIEIGGVITDFCDAAETTRAGSFSQCPNAAPSAFHRYFDDVIMIKE